MRGRDVTQIVWSQNAVVKQRKPKLRQNYDKERGLHTPNELCVGFPISLFFVRIRGFNILPPQDPRIDATGKIEIAHGITI